MEMDNLNKIIDEITLNPYVCVHSSDEDGESLFIMRDEGLAFCRVYWFSDEDKNLYFDSLVVDSSFRKLKYGTLLLFLIEKIAALCNAEYLILWVIKDSWMYDWYKRLGYNDFVEHEDPKYVWMRKKL